MQRGDHDNQDAQVRSQPPSSPPDSALASTPLIGAETSIERILQDLPQHLEMLGKVSQGGMGAIYKARNRYTGVPVAVKIVRPEFAKDLDTMRRFNQEAKAAMNLKHPNICTVHDFDVTASGSPFLVMEWIEGTSLGKIVKGAGPMAVDDAIPIFLQITSALIHAHQNKVIHRDLKPENIMLSAAKSGPGRFVHIVDFGIAKHMKDEDTAITPDSAELTKTGIIMGTPMYLSPEQARCEPIDGRADIYTLGCVMYFTISGAPPFLGPTVVDTINKHLNAPPPEFPSKLKIPANLKMIVFRCLEKNADDRYQTMEDLAEDLRKFSRGENVERKVLSTERMKRRKLLTHVLVFIACFAAMYGISTLLQNLPDSVNQNSNKNSAKILSPPTIDPSTNTGSSSTDTGSGSSRASHSVRHQ